MPAATKPKIAFRENLAGQPLCSTSIFRSTSMAVPVWLPLLSRKTKPSSVSAQMDPESKLPSPAVGGWVVGWLGGWVGGWMGGQAGGRVGGWVGGWACRLAG